MKLSKKLFMSALLLCTVSGGVMVAVAEEGEVWQQGGLATNQVSSNTASVQKSYTNAMAGLGMLRSTHAFLQSRLNIELPIIPCVVSGCATFIALGPDGHHLNHDLAGASLDTLQLNDAHTKKAQWTQDIPELQAQIRNIGGLGDIEAECEKIKESGETGGFFCNRVSATLDGTEVHVATLKNVGLEALEDVAESPLTQAEELIGANPVVQAGFGTKTAELKETISTDANQKSNSSSVWSDYVSDFGTSMNSAFSDYSAFGGSSNSSDPSDQMNEEEKRKADFRRKAHIQMVGTAGVARADLASSLAASEKAQFARLSSYIGSGGGSVVANAKVLVSLDLTLAQRLNLLNMVQGQQVANEAATALQMVE